MAFKKVRISEQNFKEAEVRAALEDVDVEIYIDRLLDAYFATETRPGLNQSKRVEP